MSKLLVISADCHAGARPETYREYLPAKHRDAADAWWQQLEEEMAARAGTFFDQDAVEDYEARAEEKGGTEKKLGAMSTSPGEWDPAIRLRELEADGIVGEVIFPQMAPFGAGLTQYRTPVDPEQNLEGIRAYNRWLADLCNAHPGRHAGVALVNVDDIDVTVREVRAAREMGLWGGVLIPGDTGPNPFYHHPRYEPLWAVCEELGMPLHAHSGWSPDYGDTPCSTAMFISEVDMWAHRPFTALLWSGAFERHPDLKLVLTEQGCSWILETLRMLEFKYDLPFFQYFHHGLSLRPTEYFERQCYLGASFLPVNEARDRHRIGVDKLMWGSDYPHLEGTWPHTLESLRATFSAIPEDETRAILGTNAAKILGFDTERLAPIADKVGPSLDDIAGRA